MSYRNNNNSSMYHNQPVQQMPQMPLGTVVNGNILTKKGWVPYKKRSGAKEVRGTTKQEGNPYFGVTGWFFSKRSGMVKVSAFEDRKSKRFSNESGEESIMMMFEVFYRDSGVKNLEVAQYKFNSGKAFLQKSGIVLSTKAPNGGFCGFLRSNK